MSTDDPQRPEEAEANAAPAHSLSGAADQEDPAGEVDDDTEFWLAQPDLTEGLARAEADIAAGRLTRSREELIEQIRRDRRELLDRLSET